jgi:hypothetical protein
MRAFMTHELMIKNRYNSEEHKKELLTPPMTYWTKYPKLEFFGKPKEILLDRQSKDYSLIRMYLLSNDPILKILNDKFTSQYHHAAANGTMRIEQWKPDENTIKSLYDSIKQLYDHKYNNDDTDIEDNNINKNDNNNMHKQFYSYLEFKTKLEVLLLGPPLLVREYQRIAINNIQFRTHWYEGNKKTTRKYIYYKFAEGIKDNNNNKRTKVAARIDKIYHVYNTSILDDRLTKAYTLLSVTNFLYVVGEKHASELPYVYEASNTQNTFTATPFISTDNIIPVNISLWNTENEQRYVVVQIDPITNEYMPIAEED